MPNLKNETFTVQKELGKYCRTGFNEPSTSIQEHTFHYRRLVFNVIKDTLKTAFPMTRKLIGRKRWKKTVAYFFENHKCRTPQVWRLPQEFSDYFQDHDFPFKKKFLFLKELLQYEWLEIEIFMMEDLPVPLFNKNRTSEESIFVPNPEIRILFLEYPIHSKNSKQISEKDKGQYFASIHRDYNTKQVKYNDLSYPFVEILIEMNEGLITKNRIIEILMKYETKKEIVLKIFDEFETFALEHNIILGYKNK
ncbi:hypothetical protein M2347_003545 [Chryseobacterium sp. H1D6B]|uniref:HvfC/BufC N-terminal domain-containing protein n=1 Tax=Chryseobacterium sp. H1D6B TaxID=2940588 RepID=UPI0015C6B0C3|nr:putative DNA-binding domain-containing protein [Chryseobacterium sp. H1D6B]MDH6253818.1 hypothetical protein [Chryseobacterium sp. H1D6B]